MINYRTERSILKYAKKYYHKASEHWAERHRALAMCTEILRDLESWKKSKHKYIVEVYSIMEHAYPYPGQFFKNRVLWWFQIVSINGVMVAVNERGYKNKTQCVNVARKLAHSLGAKLKVGERAVV